MTKHFGLRTAIAIIILAVSVVVGLAAMRLYITDAADRNVARREEVVARNGLSEWITEVERRVVGQTTWDDAVLNLGVRFDPAWAHKNIGQYLHDVSSFERAFVLDGRNNPIYGMAYGADIPPSSYKVLGGQAGVLVAKVRLKEAGLSQAPAQGAAGTTMPVPRALQASGLGMVEGAPTIITATLVQPDFGKYPLRGHAPIVVTYELMDKPLLTGFANRFLLGDLQLQPASIRERPSRAGINLEDVNGANIGGLSWRPQTPSHQVLKRSAPAMAATVAVFCGIATALFLRGRKVVRALIASETQSKHIAYHDALTGLPNRALLSQRLAQALAQMRRDGRPLGVLALDLDRFKSINDTYGHSAGDELIVSVACRLADLVQAKDTVARLGGDEFVILINDASPDGLARLAARIVADLAAPVDLPLGRAFVGASVGISLILDVDADGEEALRQADLAMYRAKDQGRGGYQFFEADMDMSLRSKRALEADLRDALRTKALTMAYQPQIDGRGRTVGLEALLRWTHPVRGPVSPAYFVPIAEECGLIGALGEFTLRQAFADSLLWPDLKVAVNVSARQIRGHQLPDLLRQILADTGADPQRLELEITESALLDDDEVTHQTLSALRHIGFSLTLDDFGTGYSSLAYLRRYPVDKIKIDRSFVSALGVEKESQAVVAAIIKLAKALNLHVIAEGVETETQRQSLRRVGCSEVQGFLYSKAIPAEAVAEFINASHEPVRMDAVA